MAFVVQFALHASFLYNICSSLYYLIIMYVCKTAVITNSLFLLCSHKHLAECSLSFHVSCERCLILLPSVCVDDRSHHEHICGTNPVLRRRKVSALLHCVKEATFAKSYRKTDEIDVPFCRELLKLF